MQLYSRGLFVGEVHWWIPAADLDDVVVSYCGAHTSTEPVACGSAPDCSVCA